MIYKIVQWFCRTLLYFIKKKINIQNFSYALTPIKKNHGSTTGNICFQPRPIYVVVWHCATVLKRDELIWIIFHNEPLCFLQTKMTGYWKETRVARKWNHYESSSSVFEHIGDLRNILSTCLALWSLYAEKRSFS